LLRSCCAYVAPGRTKKLTERLLPRAPCLAKDAQLLSEVLGLFVRALFVFQRRTTRRPGVSRLLTGAVAFV
jgi:hypothetical protein